MSLMTGLPLEERPICALLDAYQWFQLVDGDDSPQCAEAMEHLRSTELRPALRKWYRRWGKDMNPAAIAFRERMGELAGEKFG